ncbi:MAG TPA: hypothetical protein DDW84_04995 [Phycisphaerales bacterium]|nr:MAG: hypothetical protein A2Y13_00925 [Planctomycetes bacterium GWC2_45_44]HBG78193.1 hypothetical protein [Phycisphaerales bacterium]HBR19651.1 hypothetical protein [Phycisphaerales bacterium]
MKNNPFTEGTTSYIDFETMSDLQWHCSKCELKSGQAKTWQVWRQQGIQLEEHKPNRWEKRILCERCNNTTVHRKLKSLEILDDTNVRSNLPQNLTKKIKEVLGFKDAVFLRKMESNLLEVDHKFPQIRWDKDEEVNAPNMPEEEIRKKFILLTRSNNLLKSRYCERCFKTNQRGCFPGIKFWYKGEEYWSKNVYKYDEKGCMGCFWYSPDDWREELNKIVNK